MTTPTEPGCYTRQPNGCPEKMDATADWTLDIWGMSNADSGESQGACEGRKNGHDEWCGNTDSEWFFVNSSQALTIEKTPPPPPGAQ